MKVDLIKNEQAREIFLMAVSEDLGLLEQTKGTSLSEMDIEFKINGVEVDFENLANAIEKKLNRVLDQKVEEQAKKYLFRNKKEVINNRVNELVNIKIDKIMDRLQEIRKSL